MAEETISQKLSKKILKEKKSGWLGLSEKDKEEIFSFAEEFKLFMSNAKTEREAIKVMKEDLEKKGFSHLGTKGLKPGDKFYLVHKEKNLAAGIVGKEYKGLKIIGSHVDSPRLDLKPNPVFEDSDLGMLKTHYYGGIKKYQWTTIPLAIHGVIFKKDGKKIELNIGEDPADPVFIVPDLLPHLARKQMEKKGSEIIEGENLNLVVSNIPFDDKDAKEAFKLNLISMLHDKYGITEEDFFSAEVEIVPAMQPRDVGFDRSMIGAYGQDDKVCTFCQFKALTEISHPIETIISFFFDKEETGSDGNTGAKSVFFEEVVEKLIEHAEIKTNKRELLKNTKVISADVTASVNPMFKDVHELGNASFFGRGTSVEKYGGGGGKYSTSEANAEYVYYIRDLFNKHGVVWQFGELGKVDEGGGGTIAKYIAHHGCEIIDIGPGVLGMHSPYELTSKFDVYQTYKAYLVFFSNK